jgi:hypothetical protein
MTEATAFRWLLRVAAVAVAIVVIVVIVHAVS